MFFVFFNMVKLEIWSTYFTKGKFLEFEGGYISKEGREDESDKTNKCTENGKNSN